MEELFGKTGVNLLYVLILGVVPLVLMIGGVIFVFKMTSAMFSGNTKKSEGKMLGMEKDVGRAAQKIAASMRVYRENFEERAKVRGLREHSWELSDDEVSKLTEYMTDLPPIDPLENREDLYARKAGISISDVKKALAWLWSKEQVFEYRGFVITNIVWGIGETAPKLPREIFVYHGIITTSEYQSKQFRDVNKLEDWLFQQAREHGYGEEVDMIMEKGKQV